MTFKETGIKGCFQIIPKLFEDNRGYFFESFNQRLFEQVTGTKTDFVQDNQSRSTYGVLRGLHLQLGISAQAKLVRALEGSILDVAVDLRPKSHTYGQHVSFILSEENKHQLFIPRGFAHGFSVLSKNATIHYKADNYYDPNAESGIIYNDDTLKIDWKLKNEDIIISKKDSELPTLNDLNNNNG